MQAPAGPRAPPCQGFVGEKAPSIAREYHSRDFEWESCVGEGEAAVARQLLECEEKQVKEQEQGVPPLEGGGTTSIELPTGQGSWEAFHSMHRKALPQPSALSSPSPSTQKCSVHHGYEQHRLQGPLYAYRLSSAAWQCYRTKASLALSTSCHAGL